jgi:YidC/Oxa1 family membrane protein insertase
LDGVHKVINNWGWAIIVLTLLVKIALMWFSNKSYVSMAKMRALAPKMQALKEKHGDDRMAMSQAMMQLYRDEKVNPMAGCLPILIQMPIFLALYWMIVESIELRHAPWLLWIKDLSAMDPWFILPIFMGVTMVVQQRLNPEPSDPMQAKMMKIMPIIFAVFMLFFPAGLVLYWTVNNLFSMAHQHVVNKRIEKEMQAKATV